MYSKKEINEMRKQRNFIAKYFDASLYFPDYANKHFLYNCQVTLESLKCMFSYAKAFSKTIKNNTLRNYFNDEMTKLWEYSQEFLVGYRDFSQQKAFQKRILSSTLQRMDLVIDNAMLSTKGGALDA